MFVSGEALKPTRPARGAILATTLMDIHTEVFGKDVRYVDDSDDPDAMGECSTDSEEEGEAES